MVHLAMFLHSAASAGTYLAAKRALAELGPFELALLRFVLASAVYLALVVRIGRRLERGDWLRVAAIGFAGITLNQTFFLAGMRYTTPGHGALLYALTPVFVFLLARLRGQERATRAKIAGIGLAFAGTALVISSRGLLALTGGSQLAGDLLVLIGVVAWSIFAVASKPLVEKYGVLAGTGWALLVGTAIYLPIGGSFGDLGRYRDLSIGGWAAVTYMVVMTNVVAWLLYAWSLSRSEPSRVAVWSTVQPVLTALLSWGLYGERLSAPFVLGGGLVLAGVALTERG